MICARREVDLVRACVDAVRAAECPTQSTRARIRADVAVYTIDGALITVDLRWDSSIAFAP